MCAGHSWAFMGIHGHPWASMGVCARLHVVDGLEAEHGRHRGEEGLPKMVDLVEGGGGLDREEHAADRRACAHARARERRVAGAREAGGAGGERRVEQLKRHMDGLIDSFDGEAKKARTVLRDATSGAPIGYVLGAPTAPVPAARAACSIPINTINLRFFLCQTYKSFKTLQQYNVMIV